MCASGYAAVPVRVRAVSLAREGEGRTVSGLLVLGMKGGNGGMGTWRGQDPNLLRGERREESGGAFPITTIPTLYHTKHKSTRAGECKCQTAHR